MANRLGNFIWSELLTTDVDVAAAFYGAVSGWQARAPHRNRRPQLDYHDMEWINLDKGGSGGWIGRR